MIETKYQHWLNFEGLDPDLKKELEGMNDFEKNDAFLQTLVLRGYLAVVFGHEYDHLNGTLFVDRINKANPFFVPENSKPIKFK